MKKLPTLIKVNDHLYKRSSRQLPVPQHITYRGVMYKLASSDDTVWVVSTRAPDGSHIIGESPTQDGALRLLEKHLGYPSGHLSMQDIPELVDDIGGVYTIEKDEKTVGGKKTPSSLHTLLSWDTIIETGRLTEDINAAVREKLGVGEWYRLSKDDPNYEKAVVLNREFSKLSDLIDKAIYSVVPNPYSAKGGQLFKEDIEEVAKKIEGIHPKYGPLYAAELRSLK